MSDPVTVVFTDGAAKGNPGPGGWGVVILTADGQVLELGGRAAPTTNNRMELTGAIQALARLSETPGPLAIYTDSTYVIKGIREWIWGWRRRGWKTADGRDVVNRELWEQLWSLIVARGKGAIEWHYVRGHSGIPGNERVDEIADGFAVDRGIDLYAGPFSGYPRPLLDLPADTSVPARSAGASPKGKSTAHSYLSFVDGKPMRHQTWAECEKRVKGRSGARFKKAMSEADETAILLGWHVEPSDV
ncbi:MAG: RNase H family protein [Acidobacteriota bacterium]